VKSQKLFKQLHATHQSILYIVATPIGNLEDITLRALRILKSVDLIAAEDTRKTRILLNHFKIQTPLTSCFEHNEQRKAPLLVHKLKAGQNIALVSESGTPTISDPGYRLIHLALKESVPVVPVPGPCAAIAALSISGLAVHRFAFEGFLPPKTGKRKNFLKKIKEDPRTLIFYESPHRILAMINDVIEIFGDRKAVLTRELTKIHEETFKGTLSEILTKLEAGTIKGEITIAVEGNMDV
jgi:16S rRNA (cytidine1402-2'-O)-methyltransferase